MENQELVGIIKWFDNQKGFGVLVSPIYGEHFAHKSNFFIEIDSVVISDAMPFIFTPAHQKGRKVALKCRRPDSIDDIFIFLELIKGQRKVTIERVVTVKNKWGRIYKEKRQVSADVLGLSAFQLINGKDEQEITDIFNLGLQWVIKHENKTFLKDYFELFEKIFETANIIFRKENIDRSKIEEKNISFLSFRKNNRLNRSFFHELIYEGIAKMPDYLKLHLWQSFLTKNSDLEKMLDGNYGDFDGEPPEKKNLPFSPEIIVSCFDELNEKQLKKLRDYKISEHEKNNLIRKLIHSSKNKNDIHTLFKLVLLTNIFKLTTEYFDEIIDQTDPELLFEVWVNKKFGIDVSNKSFITESWPADFKLPEKIYLSNSNKICLAEIKRIKVLFNDDGLIKKILILKINSVQFDGNDLNDFFGSINLVKSEDIQKQIIENYLNSQNKTDWKFLINHKMIQFPEKGFFKLVGFNFKLSGNQSDEILQLLSVDSTISSSIRANILYKLSDKHFYQFLDNNFGLFSEKELFDVALEVNSEKAIRAIQEIWPFKSQHLAISFINYCTQNSLSFNSVFLEKINKNIEVFDARNILKLLDILEKDIAIQALIRKINFSDSILVKEFLELISPEERYQSDIILQFLNSASELEVDSIIQSIKLFLDNKVPIDFKGEKIFKNKTIHIEGLHMLLEMHNSSTSSLENELCLQIEAILDQLTSENNDLIIELFSTSNSKVLLEKGLSKIEFCKDIPALLTRIKNNDSISKVSPELLFISLLKINDNFLIEILEIGLKHFPHYYDQLAQKITLSKTVVQKFYKLILIYENEIIKLAKSSSDLNLLVQFHTSIINKTPLPDINLLFRKYNYAFQSIIVKFYLKLYFQKTIGKDQIENFLDSIDCIELSSAMIKTFVLEKEKLKSKDDLIMLMNTTFKEHLTRLNTDHNQEQGYFENIFSINDLVKNCDGRKSIMGTTFWQKGNISRHYTNGDHHIRIGHSEALYCEGRQWKSDNYYDSETGKSLPEKYNLYWCRNEPCAGVNDSVNTDLPFYDWTLSEINSAFNLKLDRLAFVYLGGWLNQMGFILSRLKCRDCEEYLRPKAFIPQKLGYYAVPIFSCLNQVCNSFKKEIRFTHCRGCGKMLDSRDCNTCNNCKWLICDNDSCKKCGCGASNYPVYAEY